jgi:hypothetical protein
MWHRLTNNINNNFNQTIIGISMIATGIFLWLDRSYFFWPPQLSAMMNSEYWDGIFIFLGAGLLACAFFDNQNKVLQHSFLIAAGAVVLMLAVTQWWHVAFAGEYRMTHSVISDLVIFVLILRCAAKS